MSPAGVDAGLFVLVVSLLVGGLAIYLGALFAFTSEDYSHAVLTAGIGAIAWTLTEWAFSLASVRLGPLTGLVSLVVWLGVIRWRYDCSWARAALVALFAWIAALVVLSALASLGVHSLDAYGIPVA